MTKERQTAWRVFSSELNTAHHNIKGPEMMSPSFQLSRLGALMNRVLIAGVLTEKENIGSEEEPLWRGKIQDIPGGAVYINIGRYQPDAAATMVDLDVPSTVAIVGKVRSYTTDDGRTFVSVRPEMIVPVDEKVRCEWLLDAAKSTWERLVAMKVALASADKTPEGLEKTGMTAETARGLSTAIEQYGMPDSTAYLKNIQAALRMLLPDDDIDFGLPDDDLGDIPEEFDSPESGDEIGSDDKEETVMRLLEELDQEGKGAPRDDLERRAEEEGISSMELEEISNTLMDKGLVYEPNLRYLKRI